MIIWLLSWRIQVHVSGFQDITTLIYWRKKTPFYSDFYLTNNSIKVTACNEYDKYKEQSAFSIDDLFLVYNQGTYRNTTSIIRF